MRNVVISRSRQFRIQVSWLDYGLAANKVAGQHCYDYRATYAQDCVKQPVHPAVQVPLTFSQVSLTFSQVSLTLKQCISSAFQPPYGPPYLG